MTEHTQTVGSSGTLIPGTPNRSLLIGIAALLGILGNAVFVMLTPLLPLMQGEYDLNISETTWIFTALTLATAASYVVFPRMSDILGDRVAAAGCAALLMAGALLPAIVQSYPALLLGSVLLGLGGASAVLPFGILRRHLSGDALIIAVIVGVISAGIGAGVGFLVGGLVVESLTIVAFFYIMAGLFALSTLAVIATIPSDHAGSDERIGILGTAWLIGWITLLLLGLSMAPTWGYTNPMTLGLIAAGIILAVFWVLAEYRSNATVFDLKLFKIRTVFGACIGAAMVGAVLSNTLLLVSYYAQTPSEVGYGLGLDALGTSIIFIPLAVMIAVGGQIGGKVIERGFAIGVSVVGASIAGVGSAWLMLDHEAQWQFLVGTGILGLGYGLATAGVFALPQLAVPEEEAGMSAGLVGTSMIIGTAIGSALVTGILSTSYVAGAPGIPEEHLYVVSFGTSVAFCVATAAIMLASRNSKVKPL
ncbi:MFS transporter [Rhodococcus wratislaviensis]|uniref:MFS transporter n=1 Tax=Rhodococcus wratislaviensis TaxID=44752 RepID=UPI003665D94D